MLAGGLKWEKKEIVLSLENELPPKFPVQAKKRAEVAVERKRA